MDCPQDGQFAIVPACSRSMAMDCLQFGLGHVIFIDCQAIGFVVKAVERAGGRTGGRGNKGVMFLGVDDMVENITLEARRHEQLPFRPSHN